MPEKIHAKDAIVGRKYLSRGGKEVTVVKKQAKVVHVKVCLTEGTVVLPDDYELVPIESHMGVKPGQQQQFVLEVLKKGPATLDELAEQVMKAGLTKVTEVKKAKENISVLIGYLKQKGNKITKEENHYKLEQ